MSQGKRQQRDGSRPPRRRRAAPGSVPLAGFPQCASVAGSRPGRAPGCGSAQSLPVRAWLGLRVHMGRVEGPRGPRLRSQGVARSGPPGLGSSHPSPATEQVRAAAELRNPHPTPSRPGPRGPQPASPCSHSRPSLPWCPATPAPSPRVPHLPPLRPGRGSCP